MQEERERLCDELVGLLQVKQVANGWKGQQSEMLRMEDGPARTNFVQVRGIHNSQLDRSPQTLGQSFRIKQIPLDKPFTGEDVKPSVVL